MVHPPPPDPPIPAHPGPARGPFPFPAPRRHWFILACLTGCFIRLRIHVLGRPTRVTGAVLGEKFVRGFRRDFRTFAESTPQVCRQWRWIFRLALPAPWSAEVYRIFRREHRRLQAWENAQGRGTL